MVDLNDLLPEGSPWMLQSAAGINASGQIAGQGLMPRRNARFSCHTKEQVNEFSTISYPRLTSATASTSGGNRNGNEIRGPSIAEQYDALQLRDEIVVIARGKRSAGSTIALKQSEAGTDYHFSLLQHELLESVALPPGIEPFTAFRGFRSSKTPVQQIRVRDKSSVRESGLAASSGHTLGRDRTDVPLVDSSFPILRVIDHMKIADRPAVVIPFSPVRRVRYPTYTPVRFLPFRVSRLATQCKSESDWC